VAISLDLLTLRGCLHQEVAVSEWLLVTQDTINRFADATGDAQWIHVDPHRAASESPFKTTIAHGFLTLSLLATLAESSLSSPGLRLAVNYGLNRVRFIAPVPAGSRVRGRFTPIGVEVAGDGSLQVTWNATIEREDGERPCCVAEWVVRYYQVRG
jgi:acyl dehydratase